MRSATSKTSIRCRRCSRDYSSIRCTRRKRVNTSSNLPAHFKASSTPKHSDLKRHIEDIYPLSPMQQGLLFHTLYAPEASEYFVQLTCTLQGELDSEAFKRVWQAVLDRHSITRTSFVWENLQQPLQIVHSEIELPWHELDWRGVSPAEQQTRLQEFLKADHKQGFDLTQAPLLRFSLIRLTENTHQFVWSHHHLLFDGWSLPLLRS